MFIFFLFQKEKKKGKGKKEKDRDKCLLAMFFSLSRKEAIKHPCKCHKPLAGPQ